MVSTVVIGDLELARIMINDFLSFKIVRIVIMKKEVPSLGSFLIFFFRCRFGLRDLSAHYIFFEIEGALCSFENHVNIF